ncbi:alkaline phosphatase family protein [Streptomyces sp. NPDC047009]|uniref:alkaline phosphatase family protein n=1 Tax=unclassified Streptomyces TaxID=2593676 RepID=UPI00340D78DD
MELLHGGQVVGSDRNTVLVQTPSEGDDTWELRVTLDPHATMSPARYVITVQYPSMLPMLTRRIPLTYLQNGFNENWNGRDYLFATLEGSNFTLQIDQQVATYYKLQEAYTWNLSDKHVSFSNFDISELHLSCGSMPSPFAFASGTLAFFQVTVHVRRRIHGEPMKVSFWNVDFDVAPFDITVRFFPWSFNRLTFLSTFDCTLLDLIRQYPGLGSQADDLHAFIVQQLDEIGYKVGAALAPWFLGADYEIRDLTFAPTSSQPDPWGLGDIVITYVGLPLDDDSGPSNTTGGPVFTSSNPPLLLDTRFLPKGRADAATEDVPYAPRGAGDVAWRPPPVPDAGGLPHPPSGHRPTTEPGDLAKVDHIVVVMMENRSFDHMLGYLSREGGRSDIEGLEPADVAVPTQFNYFNGRYYYPTHLTNTQILDSPHHSHENVKGQLADGHGHFVSDYARIVSDDPETLLQVMGYYGAELTTYAHLADQFTVCDHWFCSHPGPTIPNRFITLTGDLNRDEYGQPEVDTPDFRTFTPSETPTLFDHLTERGVSWVYFENRVSLMRAFTKYTFDMTNVRGFLDPINGFEATVAGQAPLGGSGGLPSVTFIDPAFGDLPAGTHAAQQDNDDAPPSDLMDGQRFINGIVKILFDPEANPTGWRNTMLLVVYDEHGGFYDHVEPPIVSTSLTGQGSGRLGPRVPAFVVSPWTPARSVLKDTFEHASIAATILRRFCSPHPPSMGPRVDAAADLRGALSLGRPREGRIRPPTAVPSPPSAITRTAPRQFRAPDRADDYGAFLSGLMLTLGSAPA